jgi:uncharacterized protein (DUF305 family)
MALNLYARTRPSSTGTTEWQDRRMRQLPRPHAPVLLTATVLLLVAGCGGSGTSASSSSDTHTGSSPAPSTGPSQQDTSTGGSGAPSMPHNRADVAFAGAMVTLEARTVQIAGLAPTRSHSAPVRALGQAIGHSQSSEAKMLDALLTAWDEPAPKARIPGLPSESDLARLLHATGIGFDRLWLRLVTNAEGGELSLAETERAHGANAGVVALARDVIPDRRITIERMHGLLADRGD